LALPLLACAALGAVAVSHPNLDRLVVVPSEVHLRGSDGLAQLVVSGVVADEKMIDVTATAQYSVRDGRIARVEASGLVRPLADGSTEITVNYGSKQMTVRVAVSDYANARPISFTSEVVPIFSKMGCNAGACHGKQMGQNGFKLSLLGFDPKWDYDALVNEGRGRRVFPAAPASSLLLMKPSARLPHGGGRRFETGSPEYNTLLRWVTQGMAFGTGKEPKLVKVSVSPEKRLISRKSRQQLRVSAQYDDGSETDVTRLAQYQSNAIDLATVDPTGVVTTLDSVGEAAVMVRFGGLVTVARATIPLGRPVASWTPPAPRSLVDPLVFGKLKELGIPPSEACTDGEFVRRTSLAICGVLPRPDEVAAFENDNDLDKRSKWVGRLLERPEYADFFALKWSAILHNQRGVFAQFTLPSTFAFHRWIRQSLAENKPYDQFAAEILTAKGDPESHPPVAWYRQAGRTQDEQVDDTAQLFLGMRIQCARCHHHPFEKWSQDDYYGFASFFSRVGRKAGTDPVNPRVYVLPTGLARNPTTSKDHAPKPLGGLELSHLGPYQDPRQELVNWLREPGNPFFSKALVNRYWKHFFGRGLVEPEDDMRVSNPPTNPELLDALANDFVKSGFNLKHLVRTIAASAAYERSSLPNDDNASDRQNFARYYPSRLPAEVLLDAVNTLTLSGEPFGGLPRGFRAVQLPDEGFPSEFLNVFGRPKRESVCECERTAEASLSQSLLMLSSLEIQNKLASGSGRVAAWADETKDDRPALDKIEELYRLAYARLPSQEECEICQAHLDRRRAENKLKQGFEDLAWALINSKEFQFNR
jgi:hypothetical protein